ncbi:tRNA ligase [Gaertneriomyces sp. JEL0708]|nr:tRNA ligase [Gaertneriomyces sp. JEL0708]
MVGKKQVTLAAFFGRPGTESKTADSPSAETSKSRELTHDGTPRETSNSDRVQSMNVIEKENVNARTAQIDASRESNSILKKRPSGEEDASTIPPPSKRAKRRVIDSDDEDQTAEHGTEEEAQSIVSQRDTPESEENLSSAELSDKEPDEGETEENADIDAKHLAAVTAKMMDSKVLDDTTTNALWKRGDPVPYAALCKTFEDIEATTKRLQILSFLTAFFKNVMDLSPKDLVPTVYLCLNKIGPDYEGKELGIGEGILMKAVASATGRSVPSIKADVAEQGDLGSVAQASKGLQKTMFPPPPLKVAAVFKALREIAEITGQSSQSLKVGKINKLLVACRGNEPKYLIRSLEGKLRIGLAEQSILQALGHAAALADPKMKKLSAEKRIAKLADAGATLKHVFNELPNYDEIIPSLLKYGIDDLPNHCKLRPGVPLKPMLAHPTKSLSEVLDRFENMTFTCEYKYDGERAQIHLLPEGQVHVYSRNSENLSAKYPDILESIPNVIKQGVTSFVLDCEAVAWDRDKKCILPFQVLSTRKRKDVQTSDIQVQVCVFAFDLLYLNGEPLTTKSLKERRDIMYENFHEVDGIFTFAKHMESSNVEEMQTFLDESVEGNCEGLMVKTLDKEASYEPSKRSRNWLKVKKDYLTGVGDTFDLVVIGGYVGRGKRTGWYGGYLLACYDEDREEYQSICKIGTGFSEEQLAEHAQFFKQHIIDGPKSYYAWTDSPNIRPDIWFEPVQVWEVKAADLSISPVHKAAIGLVDPGKGISLRFPRFIRIRDDKNPEQATNASQVADFYRSQKINSVGGDFEAE